MFISLTAGGFIDTTPGSTNYGKFTVGAESVSKLIFFKLKLIVFSDIGTESNIDCAS